MDGIEPMKVKLASVAGFHPIASGWFWLIGDTSHPTVSAAAVVGIPDEKWGEVVAAFVRPAPASSPTQQELFDYCRTRLAPHKTPKHWVFVDEFPLTPSGKVQKFVL